MKKKKYSLLTEILVTCSSRTDSLIGSNKGAKSLTGKSKHAFPSRSPVSGLPNCSPQAAAALQHLYGKHNVANSALKECAAAECLKKAV